MFWGQTQKLLFRPKNIILNRNNNNNLVWLKMGNTCHMGDKVSIETLKLVPCSFDQFLTSMMEWVYYLT